MAGNARLMVFEESHEAEAIARDDYHADCRIKAPSLERWLSGIISP